MGRSGPAGSVSVAYVELRLAGTFRVVRDGTELTDGEIGSRKSRTLLKLLAVERPGLVPVDRIVDILWPNERPAAPEQNVATLVAVSAGDLLAAAADRLGLGCDKREIHGSERAVVTASAQADLLIVARDGDPARLGPKSLGKAARFVVDHAACPVLLVWPGSAPDVATIPPAPHHPSPPDQ